MAKRKAATFGQDLMRGEHLMGSKIVSKKSTGGVLMAAPSSADPEFYQKKRAVESKLGRSITTAEFQAITNMSVVAHIVDRVNHRALVSKGRGIRLSGFKAGKIFAGAIDTSSSNRAKANCCIKAKGFVSVKCHFFLRCVNLILQNKTAGATE